MSEYIVRETGYPGELKQEIVGELVRCKECKWYDISSPYGTVIPDAYHCKINDRFYDSEHFCGYGERRTGWMNTNTGAVIVKSESTFNGITVGH